MVQKHCISPLIGSNIVIKRKERGLLGISKKSSPHSRKLGLIVSGPSLRLASVQEAKLQDELEPVIGQVSPRLGGQLLKELNQLERVLDQVRSQSLNLALGQLRRYPTQATDQAREQDLLLGLVQGPPPSLKRSGELPPLCLEELQSLYGQLKRQDLILRHPLLASQLGIEFVPVATVSPFPTCLPPKGYAR